jgi:hypothetical protein
MDELMDLEERGWRALSEGRGPDFFGRLFTADAVVVVPGTALDRQQTLASREGVPAWTEYDLKGGRRLDLAPDSAAHTYRMVARRGDGPPYRATSPVCTYAVTGNGSSRFHQQTPEP